MSETLLERNKKVAQRFFYELVNDRDYSVIPRIFSPDVEIRFGIKGLAGIGLDGIEGAHKWLRHFHDAFSDCRDELLGQWAEGDVVVTHIVYRGINDGPWLGKAPTGQKIAWTAVAIHVIRDGLIVKKTGAIDQADVFRQLGWLNA
jgi:predicted ester cyclase